MHSSSSFPKIVGQGWLGGGSISGSMELTARRAISCVDGILRLSCAFWWDCWWLRERKRRICWTSFARSRIWIDGGGKFSIIIPHSRRKSDLYSFCIFYLSICFILGLLYQAWMCLFLWTYKKSYVFHSEIQSQEVLRIIGGFGRSSFQHHSRLNDDLSSVSVEVFHVSLRCSFTRSKNLFGIGYLDHLPVRTESY
jgi:hypothetical protein